MLGRNNFSAVDITSITAIIQTAINPLVSKIQTLEEKVDRLGQDRITRSDMEKLTLTFVQRDAYETRHAVLVDQAREVEADLRDLRKIHEEAIQRLREQLEISKKQTEEQLKQQQETALSSKDRAWVRWSITAGWIATALSIITFLLSHLRLTN